LRVTGFEKELDVASHSRAILNRVHERRRDTAAPQIRSHPEPFHFADVQCRARNCPDPNASSGMGIGASHEEYAQRRPELLEV